MWSRKYKQCQECGTTERRHYGNGLCWRCYNRQRTRENPGPNRDRAQRHYTQHTEKKKQYQRERYWKKRDAILQYLKLWREKRDFDGMRETILKRDGYRCRECGSEENLLVHHRDGSGKTIKPNNDLANLLTLCNACHVRVHLPRKGTGKKEKHHGQS